jgi:hypothetical protein
VTTEICASIVPDNFNTDITALQVEMLAALKATKHCDIVELF